MAHEKFSAAGNVEVPAYLTLLKLGYQVECTVGSSTLWCARNDSIELIADGCIELIGLHLIRKERGTEWQATDLEIESFLKKFAL